MECHCIYVTYVSRMDQNTNGLVRQYLKKCSDFRKITDVELYLIAEKLNSRPRKSLNYATPDEVFFLKTRK